jgi:hypothetical protein
MEEWEIAFFEESKLHPDILKDIQAGICPREVSNKLAVFSHELRQACFGDNYTNSRVNRAYKNSRHLANTQERLAKIEEYRSIYRTKSEEWKEYLNKYDIRKGNVYLLSNMYMPGLIKVGYTEKADVYERRDELYYEGQSGVPYPFDVEHSRYTIWPSRSEKTIHEQLREYRINSDREFFEIKLERAKAVMNQVILETEKLVIETFNKNNTLLEEKNGSK